MGFTNVGKQIMLEWLIGNDPSVPSHIGVGTGTVVFSVTDTSLGTEVYPDASDRNVIDTASRIVRQATIDMLLSAGDLSGTDGITEAGLFDAATSGNMFTRNVFNEVPKTSSTEITVVESVRFV